MWITVSRIVIRRYFLLKSAMFAIVNCNDQNIVSKTKGMECGASSQCNNNVMCL